MSDERKRTELEVVQLTVAVCKQEVEKLIGGHLLNVVDNGSVCGRAFLLASQALKETP